MLSHDNKFEKCRRNGNRQGNYKLLHLRKLEDLNKLITIKKRNQFLKPLLPSTTAK